VRRHPWRAMLVAASAGMAVALLSHRSAQRPSGTRKAPRNDA